MNTESICKTTDLSIPSNLLCKLYMIFLWSITLMQMCINMTFRRILDNLPLVVPIKRQDQDSATVYQHGFYVGVKDHNSGVSTLLHLKLMLKHFESDDPCIKTSQPFCGARMKNILSTTIYRFSLNITRMNKWTLQG